MGAPVIFGHEAEAVLGEGPQEGVEKHAATE